MVRDYGRESTRYSLKNRHSRRKKGLVKSQLEEANGVVEQWKNDLNGLDEHVKKVEVEKASTEKAQSEMAAKRRV